ncbi:DUF397 domain-containing protein [Streptomyces sp. NPDC058534]|uniref:DUF397 domain-containing protein n=1 Tax=Streptomyces sp. NPDC058534 TaxID=3346541 RepID=UPI003669C678
MTSTSDLHTVTWRKSSYSNGDGGACVEVATGCLGTVPIRDSKIAASPVVVVSNDGWSAFLDAVKGEPDTLS